MDQLTLRFLSFLFSLRLESYAGTLVGLFPVAKVAVSLTPNYSSLPSQIHYRKTHA